MVAIIPASAQREVKSRSVCTNVRPMAVSGDRGESSVTSMYSSPYTADELSKNA